MKINYQIKIFDREILGTLSKQYGLWFVPGISGFRSKATGSLRSKIAGVQETDSVFNKCHSKYV